jgi:hypothetical protein
MGRKLGTAGRIVKRKELRPKRELTDEQLLARAARDAEKWQKSLRKHSST